MSPKNKFLKFINEINKISPFLNKDILNYSVQEIYLLNIIKKYKKINTIKLVKIVDKNFSRAQLYRYLKKLKKKGIIKIAYAEISIK